MRSATPRGCGCWRRGRVAALLGASPAEIVFTSGGTEATHQAILGALALAPDRRHVVTSAVEHPSTLRLLWHLRDQGLRITCLPVDAAGRLDLAALAAAVGPDTALVSLMWANNETGVVFPVAQAAAIAHARGALLHTDAVQAVGKLPIDVGAVPVDLLSLSGHKLYGPQGTGALFVRKGLRLPPLFYGQQERGRRGGTENLPGCVGLGVACALAADALTAETARLAALRARLERGIAERIPAAHINGAGAMRLCNTLSVTFVEAEAEVILSGLDRVGIQASAGAACSARGQQPSHVLTAMGLDAPAALASVRFSLGRANTAADIDHLLDLLPDLVAQARRTGPPQIAIPQPPSLEALP